MMMTEKDTTFNEHRFQYRENNLAVFGLLLRPRASAIAAGKAKIKAGIIDCLATWL